MTGAPTKLLLVEDERLVRITVRDALVRAGYQVTDLGDGAAALRAAEAARFDVVLTDVRMPQVTGFEVLAAARRGPEPSRVVMMTGFACVADAVAAMRQGAFDYLPKPLEAEEIALVVARALQEPDGEGSAEGGAAAGVPAEEVAAVFHDAVAAARDRASRDYLLALMRQFHGNVTHAALRAGVTRESLHRLLKKYGVHSEAFKGR